MSYKHNDIEIELCREIGISMEGYKGNCHNCNPDMYDSQCYECINHKKDFKLLCWNDVEEILNKYVNRFTLTIDLRKGDILGKKLEKCKCIYINVIEKSENFMVSGETSLEAGLRAVIKIAEILNIPANKL